MASTADAAGTAASSTAQQNATQGNPNPRGSEVKDAKDGSESKTSTELKESKETRDKKFAAARRAVVDKLGLIPNNADFAAAIKQYRLVSREYLGLPPPMTLLAFLQLSEDKRGKYLTDLEWDEVKLYQKRSDSLDQQKSNDIDCEQLLLKTDIHGIIPTTYNEFRIKKACHLALSKEPKDQQRAMIFFRSIQATDDCVLTSDWFLHDANETRAKFFETIITGPEGKQQKEMHCITLTKKKDDTCFSWEDKTLREEPITANQSKTRSALDQPLSLENKLFLFQLTKQRGGTDTLGGALAAELLVDNARRHGLGGAKA